MAEFGFTIALLVLLLGSFPVAAAKKIAWVIGNSAYGSGETLRNPVRDADLVATPRKNADYSVVVSKSLNATLLDSEFSVFRSEATDTDIAIVFYTGNGLALNESFHNRQTGIKLYPQ